MHAYNFQIYSAGATLEQEEGYRVFSALTKVVPELHGCKGLQVAPIRGSLRPDSKLQLDRGSKLHIRVPNPEVAAKLSQQALQVGEHMIFLGVPEEVPLEPQTLLVSKLVVLRNCFDREVFLQRLHQLLPKGVSAAHLGSSGTIPFKGRHFKGYSVILNGLTPEASLEIQKTGIGMLKSMGCGVFYKGANIRKL